MNYLGHLVLSGSDPQILFGNFIADSIKGKSYLKWPIKIQKGILLHRFIDDFTDSNIHYLKGKRRFYKEFPKMGGVITDILYDYLLWKYELKYQKLNLDNEINRYYSILNSFENDMPENIRYMYGYMKKDDWLNNYKYEIGIKKALHGIGKRINYSNDLEKSFEILNASILEFELEFELFFNEIKEKTSSFFVV